MDSGRITVLGTFAEVRAAVPDFDQQAALLGLKWVPERLVASEVDRVALGSSREAHFLGTNLDFWRFLLCVSKRKRSYRPAHVVHVVANTHIGDTRMEFVLGSILNEDMVDDVVHLVNAVFHLTAAVGFLTVYGAGSQNRCFCHVSDVVRTLTQLMDVEGAKGRVFNAGSQSEISIFGSGLNY